MTEQGRKVRFELTPLEAEAIFSAGADILSPGMARAFPRFERRRGPGIAKSALLRATDKIGKEISRS
jgi:hypothetical protein